MNETSLIQIRVDEELKKDATDVLDRLGLDVSTAVRMFLKRVVLDQGLPFSTSLPRTYAEKGVPDKEEKTVIHIPAKKSVKIPREIVEHIIRQVPPGKITCYEHIEQFLQSFYGCERVELQLFYTKFRNRKNINGNRKYIPKTEKFCGRGCRFIRVHSDIFFLVTPKDTNIL